MDAPAHPHVRDIRPPWKVEVQVLQEQKICRPPWKVEVQVLQEQKPAKAILAIKKAGQCPAFTHQKFR